jgi:predicted nucleic acid-binding protein
MKLDEIGGGSVYLDTNVLYMFLRSDPLYLPIIQTFMEKVVAGEVEALITVSVLDELFYRLLLAHVKDTTRGNPLDALKRDLVRVIAAHAAPVEAALRKLMAFPHLNVAGVEAADFDSMLINIRTFSLLPRDALHLAAMQRLGVPVIASDDKDFDRVTSVERAWVFNPPTP